MFFSYLSSALLNLRKQPIFSAIKILSLSLGLAAAMLVLMHVQFAQSSNLHISNWANTYRMLTHLKMREINLPYRTAMATDAHAPLLKSDFGDQLQYITRIQRGYGFFGRNDEASQNDFFWAEPDAVHIFDLQFVAGDPDTAISQPNAVLLSQKAVAKYFGDQDAMGQTMTLNESTDLIVTGLIEDQPINATHSMDIVVSKETGVQMYGPNFMGGDSWMTFAGSETFITLAEGVEPAWFSDNVPAFFDRHMPDSFKNLAEDLEFNLSLQNIRDIYLNSFDNFASPENTREKTILIGLMVFAFLILASSCINYVNLSLSQIVQRTKEIGVRKTLGASRLDIVIQFLFESLLLTFIALLVALPIIYLAIPVYTNLTSTRFTFIDMFESTQAINLFGLILLTGLVAGIFPALAVSKVEAANAAKGVIARSRVTQLIRTCVTALQFTISTALILLALATYTQITFLQEMDVGFDKENLVMLDSRFNYDEPDLFNYTAMLNDLRQHPTISSVTSSSFLPPDGAPLSQWRLARNDPNATMSIVYGNVSEGFTETYGFELIAGRSFSSDFQSDFYPPSDQRQPDDSYGVVITDSTAKRLGIESPEAALQEVLILGETRYRIIGVVKRFQFTSGMESEQRSIGILIGRQEPLRGITIRVNPMQTEAALKHIDDTWAVHRGNTPIDRYFYSQSLNNLVVNRNKGLSTASLLASSITIIIAALGLYALASYATARRTKEIGVRKVLGASSSSVVGLLSWDFVQPVLIACVISWPIAYFAIDLFYSNFATSTDFPWAYYLLVTAAIASLAFITVVMQCYRTASSDPVHSLRYE